MATPWRSEEERNEYFEKLKLEDVICPEKSIEQIIVEELDNMICKEIVTLFKDYFPNSAIDEQKVLKLAKMLIAEEKTESQKVTETSDLEEKIRKFENDATDWAIQIAIDVARRLFKQTRGYMPLYPGTEEELLWIGNYAKEMMHNIANEILESDEPFEPITEVSPYEE